MSKPTPQKKATGREVAQVGRFGIIGIVNTLIDFSILNIITRVTVLPIYLANIPATTVAMLFSFFANRYYVFTSASKSKPLWRQALEFFPITAFGLYVIQGSIIYFFEFVWTAPVDVLVNIVHWIGLNGVFDDQFVRTNSVKIVATLASLTWNYIMYKKVVFKQDARDAK